MKPLSWVYVDQARMDRQCPNLDCLAPPNEYCRRPDGHIRRVPCIARMRRPDPAVQLANEQLAEEPPLELHYDQASGIRTFELAHQSRHDRQSERNNPT